MLNSKINTIKYSYIIYSTVPMTQKYVDAERYTPYMYSPACVPVLPNWLTKGVLVYKTVYDERKCKTSSN